MWCEQSDQEEIEKQVPVTLLHCVSLQTSVSKTVRKPPLVTAKTALKIKKKYIAKNDFQYGGWNSYTKQCGMIMTLLSRGDCILQMWHVALGWHAIEFARWQHPATWHVALELWHWIRQVAAPCTVAGGSGITCHWVRLNVRHTGILHLVSISITSPQSPKFYPYRTTLGRKKWRHVDFQDGGSQPSWILGIQ